MKNLLLTLIALLFSFNLLYSADIVQILSEDNPQYIISITHGGEYIGEIKIELFPEVAPKHSHNFDSLVSISFYDRTAFHRVIPNFMIQGGDPNSRDKPKSTWGYGDPSQTKVQDEFSTLKHLRGTMAAAKTLAPNSATSQFYITVVPTPWLDGKYSIYGEVIDGMDVVDYIVNVPRDNRDNPNEKVEMTIVKNPTSGIVNQPIVNQPSDNIIIKVYPNPAMDIIKLIADDNIDVKSIKIKGLNGNTIIDNEYPEAKNITDLNIDVSRLVSGIYSIQLNDIYDKTYILKIVVNR